MRDSLHAGGWLALALLWLAVPAAQLVGQDATPRGVVLPSGDLFRPLLADPKQPQFFATYMWARSARLGAQLTSVGFGRDIGLVRLPSGHLQISLAAGVFSQFNMHTKSSDLLDVDYVIGIPVTYRHGNLSARVQIYHESSHLGDEYIFHTQAQWVDLTYEAFEALLTGEMGNWRLYGGGEYLYAHQPSDLKPGRLHGGLEYRQRTPLVRLGRFGDGRLVGALDARSFQDRRWQVGLSLQTGFTFAPITADGRDGWGWSVLLEGYTGPAPFGQFFRDTISSVGFGVAFDL